MPFEKWEIWGFLTVPIVCLVGVIATADYGWPYPFGLWWL
jgi:hypothetical protein